MRNINELCHKLYDYASIGPDGSRVKDTEYWHSLVILYKNYFSQMNGSFRSALADEIEKQCAFIDAHYEIVDEKVEVVDRYLKYKS